MKLAPLQEVVKAFAAGQAVVIVDDRDRENEGDITVAAELVTSEQINFMISEARGLFCLTLTEERAEQLKLPLQVRHNTSSFGTAFTVSIDHSSVQDSGASAEGRARTIQKALDPGAKPADFCSPGWVFPLRAVPGGVLKRRGQTEGSVDLARLAGLKPAGVICEIMSPSGVMLAGGELEDYCERHSLLLTSVEEIARHRLEHEVFLRRVAELSLEGRDIAGLDGPLTKDLKVVVFLDDVDNEEHLAFVKGNPGEETTVRIHSECLTGDVLGSLRCDCGFQLSTALKTICEAGEGVVVYLHQEGRGIGLGNKLRAYELQDSGFDTVDANLELGLEVDSRNYRVAASMLSDLGIRRVKVLTNNPEKIRALEHFGIQIVERVPVLAELDDYNRRYLLTKRERLGHLI